MTFNMLNPEYNLPTSRDYDEVILKMQEMVEEAGSAPHFMGNYTEARRSHISVRHRVLEALTKHAFYYEDYDADGAPPKTDLSMSRGILSGMMFGHVANEALYPEIYVADPYRKSQSVNKYYLPQAQAELFSETAKNEYKRALAYRIGVSGMSSLFTSQLSAQSIETISDWGDEMVGSDRRQLFTKGFGNALYLAWDRYSDLMVLDGRTEDIYSFPSITKPSTPTEVETPVEHKGGEE